MKKEKKQHESMDAVFAYHVTQREAPMPVDLCATVQADGADWD